jgi:predicted transposase/invertase (TIGR01784 family)
MIVLDTLQMENCSFTDRELKHRESDMLYRVFTQDEEVTYLYLLIEHQSTIDERMAFRLQHYIMLIIDRHLRQNKGKLPLPVVFPLVFYNGQKEYRTHREIFPLFGKYESLARDIFLKPYILINVADIPDEELRNHRWSGILEWCMLHAVKREILPSIRIFSDLMQLLYVQSSDDLITSVLKYIIESMHIANQAEDFIEVLCKEAPPLLETKIMTIAEYLISKGKLEGKLEGIREALRAIELLKEGLSLKTVANMTGIRTDILRLLNQKVSH